MKLPPVPRKIDTPVGPVKVRIVTRLATDNGTELQGVFNAEAREITLRRSKSRATMWLTLFHEWVHLVMYEAGISFKTETEERFCDVFAAALMAQLTHEKGLVTFHASTLTRGMHGKL